MHSLTIGLLVTTTVLATPGCNDETTPAIEDQVAQFEFQDSYGCTDLWGGCEIARPLALGTSERLTVDLGSLDILTCAGLLAAGWFQKGVTPTAWPSRTSSEVKGVTPFVASPSVSICVPVAVSSTKRRS